MITQGSRPSRFRILSVSRFEEDHRSLAQVLDALGREFDANCSLSPAFTLQSALALLPREQFSLVFTDDDLCPGSWRDLLDSVNDHPQQPPLIVMSRLADEHLWAEVLNRGGYDVLAKPFDTEEALRVVRFAPLRRNVASFSRATAASADAA